MTKIKPSPGELIPIDAKTGLRRAGLRKAFEEHLQLVTNNPDKISDAQLILDEALNNALDHGAGNVKIMWTVEGKRLKMRVEHDVNPQEPQFDTNFIHNYAKTTIENRDALREKKPSKESIEPRNTGLILIHTLSDSYHAHAEKGRQIIQIEKEL